MKTKLQNFFTKKPFLFSGTLIFFFILIEFTFSFCSKVHCDAFEDEYFDVWFPYQVGQTLYFKTETGLVDTIKISSIEKSDSFDQYATKGECDAHASIWSNNEPNSYLRELYFSYSKSNSYNFFEVSIKSSRFQGTELTQKGIAGTYKSTFHNTLTLNNLTFSNVQQIEADTVKRSSGVHKIWLSRNKGLIGFEYFETKIKWILQPN